MSIIKIQFRLEHSSILSPAAATSECWERKRAMESIWCSGEKDEYIFSIWRVFLFEASECRLYVSTCEFQFYIFLCTVSCLRFKLVPCLFFPYQKWGIKHINCTLCNFASWKYTKQKKSTSRPASLDEQQQLHFEPYRTFCNLSWIVPKLPSIRTNRPLALRNIHVHRLSIFYAVSIPLS